MSPARTYVRELLGFDPGCASPTSGYGDRFLLGAGLSGQFNSSTPRLGMLYYKNRTARCAKDLWAAAVVLRSPTGLFPELRRGAAHHRRRPRGGGARGSGEARPA